MVWQPESAHGTASGADAFVAGASYLFCVANIIPLPIAFWTKIRACPSLVYIPNQYSDVSDYTMLTSP